MFKCPTIYFIVLVTLAMAMTALAQQPIKDAKAYRLGPRDVLFIEVLNRGQKEFEARLVVSDQGSINVPLMGSVQAAGLTIPELEKKLFLPLERDFFVDPQVHISVSEYHSLSFFIAGAVKEPGVYELNFIPSLMDLIVKAGGAEDGRGNVAYILKNTPLASTAKKDIETAIRKKEPIKVNLTQLLDQGDMSENLMLASGDTVYIPLGKVLNQAQSKVYVQGQVKEPGMFEFQPGMTAMSACILAGGFSKYSAPGRTLIVRRNGDTPKTIKIDLDKVADGKITDIPLMPGDRIKVPQSWF